MKKNKYISFRRYLRNICKNCISANGYCIKDFDYIGLCSVNDRDELFESRHSKYFGSPHG